MRPICINLCNVLKTFCLSFATLLTVVVLAGRCCYHWSWSWRDQGLDECGNCSTFTVLMLSYTTLWTLTAQADIWLVTYFCYEILKFHDNLIRWWIEQIKNPIVCGVSPLGMDHMETLGAFFPTSFSHWYNYSSDLIAWH